MHIKENPDFPQQKPWQLPSTYANLEVCYIDFDVEHNDKSHKFVIMREHQNTKIFMGGDTPQIVMKVLYQRSKKPCNRNICY